VSNLNGSDSREVFKGTALMDAPAWSRDGTRLRFRQFIGPNPGGTLWEVGVDGKNPHQLFEGRQQLGRGSWTSDGKYFVFSSRKPGEEGLFAVREKTGWFQKAGSPVPLTTGTLTSFCAIPSRAGKQIITMGEQPQAELVSYDIASHQFSPYLGGIAAEWLAFSQDGQWVAYTTFPEGELWRSKVDGSQKLKLTGGAHTALPRWSRDGKHISFIVRQPVQLQVISAEGGAPEPLPMGDSPTAAHDWSPDGNSMVLGGWGSAPGTVLRMLDLKTKQISVLPGSEGLVYPFWSPDGRYIAAYAESGPRYGAWLYEVAKKEWKKLPLATFNNWAWSHDSAYIYYDYPADTPTTLMRMHIPDGKIEQVADWHGVRRAPGELGNWFGLDPKDRPLVVRFTGNPQIYAVDWDAP
jgi:Tol biopolymer transport system component